MARERVIVSIGEALLCERGERIEPGGLALSYTAAAAALGKAGGSGGYRGFAVSRIGQDAAGDELLRQARALGVDVNHIQSDPDLPTGRLVTRSIAGRVSSSLTSNAAFDNLQWDFDMIDLAQRADAVIFGQLARRGGQTKSVIKQFLLECVSAAGGGGGGGGGSGASGGGGGGPLRVFDLTNRTGDTIERSEAWTGLEFCDVVVCDEAALKGLVPAAGVSGGGGGDESANDIAAIAARELFRSTNVHIVVAALRQGDRERLRAVSRDESIEAGDAFAIARHDAAIMQVIDGLLSGKDLAPSIRGAATS